METSPQGWSRLKKGCIGSTISYSSKTFTCKSQIFVGVGLRLSVFPHALEDKVVAKDLYTIQGLLIKTE